MSALKVYLRNDERQALLKLAHSERRNLAPQAAVIIRRELERATSPSRSLRPLQVLRWRNLPPGGPAMTPDPIVQILLETAQRGRELRRQREAQVQQAADEAQHDEQPDQAGDDDAQHEAERIDRREKVVLRADSDVLSLLEQAILDASGENVRVRLLPNGWLSFPPMMAVLDAEQTRYIFSPTPPDQVQAIARRQGLAQLLLGRATDLTAYPIDALNSTPFIADDLSGAYGYVLARHQAPRRPLPRTDRWYLYLARPRTSRWPRWSDGRAKQTGSLKRFTDRLHGAPDSKPSSSTADRTSTPSGPPTA